MAAAGDGVGISSRVSKATLANWQDKITDIAKKRFVLLGALAKKGRIKRGQSGGEIRWIVNHKYHDLNDYVDGAATDFVIAHNITNAKLRWGGYDVRDAVTNQELAENGGDEAVVKLFAQKSAEMQRSALQRFGRKFYVDGGGSNAEFHGIESFMSLTGQVATDEYATTLNDTYAGISTSRTGFNAAATAVDPEFAAWSPVVVNSNRTVGASTNAWADFADDYLRSGIIGSCYSEAKEDQIDTILLKKASFQSLLNLLDDKERVNLVSSSEAKAAYGFAPTGMVSFDGVMVGWDEGVASPDAQAGADVVHGYGWNTDRLKLMLLGSSSGSGPNVFTLHTGYDIARLADLYKLVCMGNFVFDSPKYFVKFAELS